MTWGNYDRSFRLLIVVVLATVTHAGKPLQSVQVTLRGRVYQIDRVSTVQELHERLEEESGLEPLEQGRATFQGRVLPGDDNQQALGDLGLQDGDQINMVPQSLADRWIMMRDMGEGLISLQNRVHLQGPFASPEDKEQVKVMSELYEDLIKPPFLPDEMERFSRALQDPDAMERTKEPEWIESLRQVILNNPTLLKHMLSEVPGSREALQNRESWYQYAVDSVDRWMTMSEYELWQRFSEGRLFCGKE